MATIQLDVARRTVAGIMADGCEIIRPSDSDPTFDEDTGLYTLAAPTTIFTGPCFIIPPRGVVEREIEVGGKRTLVRLYRAKIPYDAVLPAVDDVLRVTASVYDPALVDQELLITNVDLTSVLVWRNLDLRFARAL